MANTLQQQNDIAYQPSFQSRVVMAVYQAAVSVQGECALPCSSPPTNHTNRSNWALKVLTNQTFPTLFYALAVASDGLTDNTVTDTALQNRVNSLVNFWAGVL